MFSIRGVGAEFPLKFPRRFFYGRPLLIHSQKFKSVPPKTAALVQPIKWWKRVLLQRDW